MNFYKGACDLDIPYNGGSFVKENGYGHEENNFNAVIDEDGNDICLGFVETKTSRSGKSNELHIERIPECEYLKKDDFVGSDRFVDANGNITEGTIVNLRDVDFGGMKINNVRASVVRNQKAPLLLGQSVLGRLGSIEIDNPGKKLIITHSK